MQRLDRVRRKLDEYTVGLNGREQSRPRKRRKRVGEALGHRVRVTRMPEPRVVLEHAEPRRRKESHFGCELTRLFASPSEFLRERVVEEDDRLSDGQAVFRPAKTKHI